MTDGGELQWLFQVDVYYLKMVHLKVSDFKHVLPSVFISVLIYNIMDHFVSQTCSSGRQLLIDIIAV